VSDLHDGRRGRSYCPCSLSSRSAVSACIEDLDKMPPYEGGQLDAVAFNITTVIVLGEKAH